MLRLVKYLKLYHSPQVKHHKEYGFNTCHGQWRYRGTGKPWELLAKKGFYANLYYSQFENHKFLAAD